MMYVVVSVLVVEIAQLRLVFFGYVANIQGTRSNGFLNHKSEQCVALDPLMIERVKSVEVRIEGLVAKLGLGPQLQ